MNRKFREEVLKVASDPLLAAIYDMVPNCRDRASINRAMRAIRWLRFTGSRLSNHRGAICYLLNKRCGSHHYDCHKHPLPDGLVDHPQTFSRKGKPFAWTTQPYRPAFEFDGKIGRLRAEYRKALDEFCSLHNLEWFEDFGGSWWYPRETTLVVVKIKELARGRDVRQASRS